MRRQFVHNQLYALTGNSTSTSTTIQTFGAKSQFCASFFPRIRRACISTAVNQKWKTTVAPNKVNGSCTWRRNFYASAVRSATSNASKNKPSKKEEARLKQAARDTMNRKTQGGGVEGDIVARVDGLTKVLPGPRKLFEETYLSFLRGAKIGVVGLNGSGKSSLFRILAGIDK